MEMRPRREREPYNLEKKEEDELNVKLQGSFSVEPKEVKNDLSLFDRILSQHSRVFILMVSIQMFNDGLIVMKSLKFKELFKTRYELEPSTV
jgi:hypothetical protein